MTVGPDPAQRLPDVTLRPLTRDDFPLVHRWLNVPQVRAWWREDPRTLPEVERKYGPRVDDDGPVQLFVIDVGADAVGLIQCYRHADDPGWDRTVGIPAAIGIDYLIGEPSRYGQGVGSTAIAALTTRAFTLYPDAEVVVGAPQADNRASRRALEKAGFRLVEERQLDSDDPSDAGPSAIYVFPRPRRA